jgi:hypothetical protein
MVDTLFLRLVWLHKYRAKRGQQNQKTVFLLQKYARRAKSFWGAMLHSASPPCPDLAFLFNVAGTAQGHQIRFIQCKGRVHANRRYMMNFDAWRDLAHLNTLLT